jgi:hypothetical protein
MASQNTSRAEPGLSQYGHPRIGRESRALVPGCPILAAAPVTKTRKGPPMATTKRRATNGHDGTPSTVAPLRRPWPPPWWRNNAGLAGRPSSAVARMLDDAQLVGLADACKRRGLTD